LNLGIKEATLASTKNFTLPSKPSQLISENKQSQSNPFAYAENQKFALEYNQSENATVNFQPFEEDEQPAIVDIEKAVSNDSLGVKNSLTRAIELNIVPPTTIPNANPSPSVKSVGKKAKSTSATVCSNRLMSRNSTKNGRTSCWPSASP
jgi:hypothetical protein